MVIVRVKNETNEKLPLSITVYDDDKTYGIKQYCTQAEAASIFSSVCVTFCIVCKSDKLTLIVDKEPKMCVYITGDTITLEHHFTGITPVKRVEALEVIKELAYSVIAEA